MSSAARLIALYLAVHSLCVVDAQVLLNPSFDFPNGLDSWSGVSATVIANTAQTGDGDFHVKLAGFPSSISQDITGLTVGTSYRVRFLVSASKANSLERMRVTVGTDEKRFRGVPNVFTEVDVYFKAASESENLKVENVNSNWRPDGSRSVLLDGFSVVAADPPPISPLDNPSFEVDEMGAANQDYLYMVPSGWIGSGGTVMARNTNSPWGSLSSGVGKYYAALQNKGASLGGVLYNLTDGQEYRVQFLSAGRPHSAAGTDNQIMKVSIDDIEIFRRAMPTKAFRMYTATFTASSTTHFIKFEQDAPESGDKTVFLDAVSLYASDPSTSVLINPSFEEDDLWEVFNDGGSTHQHYAYIQPAGWAKTGSTVVAYNKNSEWGLTPSWGEYDSKAGRNFAVLQRQGASLSQIVSGFLEGRTYKISFLAARRPNSRDSSVQLQVRVNEQVVKVGWTPPKAFTLYEIAFEAPATTAEIKFENVSPDEEDRSVFIDAVSIVRPAVCTTDHDYELQGSCWKVLSYQGGVAHAGAESDCKKWGGELATIKKQIENERLLQRMLTHTGVTSVWLGGQRDSQGGAWIWPDGTDVSDYTNWGNDEPDNEDLMAMKTDGTWSASGNGDTIHAAACQKPATVCDVVSSGYCYAVHTESVNRTDASALCKAWGGSLATIPDQTAEAKLGQFLSRDQSSMPPAWVGASRSMPGAHWRWDDSAPITYLNFQTSEPENDESCAIADPANGAALLGSPCSLVTSPYICSRRLMTPCSGQQTRSASSGLIGDMHSLPEQLCTWLIQPSVLAKSITLTFKRLDIEKGFDYVHVYDENDNKIASYTGSETLPEVEVQGPMIKVVFDTDWAVQNENGFEAEYVATTMTCSDYPCDNRSTCAQELDGTFTCVCNDGYMGDGDLSYDGPGCSDINECTSNSVPYPCGQNARCDNTIGSATCTCEVGYAGYPYDDDSTNAPCANILECEAATIPCAADATCADTNGSFTCTCHTGFSGNGTYCDDINECTEGSPCDSNAECTNLDGSFKCECNDGWQGNGFPGECSDVNECAPGNVNTCEELHGVCHNEPGSYWCNCSAGWTTADNFDPAQPYGNGSVCYDANECAFGTHNCDVDAICTNLDETFSCSCPTGFVGDGLECFELCSETESDACHTMAYCQDATCICPEGIYGGGYGATGCTREAWSVRFSIRLPWVTSADLTASNKLENWETYQPDYILLLTTSPPAGFSTSMHHEVQLLDSALPGGLLTISSLFGSEADANAARVRLQGSLDAATPPTVFGVTLTASQTTIEGAAARRDLDNTTGLIVGSYPVEPRVYTWVAETTSAEIRVLPTGLNVDSLYFEPACKQTGCWVAEITYTTGEDNFNVIYIPNAQTDNDSASFDFDYDVQMNSGYAMTALETFTISNFPCGSDGYVPDPNSDIPTKVTACCIPEFVQLYRPVTSFISEVASKVTQATCDSGTLTYFLPASFIETDDTIAYKGKPSDAVWGGFAGMDYAEVVFTGVLDPFVRQYSATVYFDEAELRQKAGILRGTVGVEHTVDTFIGIANFKPTGIAFLDSFAMQVNLHLEKTSFFSVSTHGVNDYTFLEYVNMRLVSIYAEDVDFSSLAEADNRTLRTNSSGNANYIQVTFTMGDQYQPNPLSGGLIPLDSVRAGRGTFFSSTTLEHLCVSYDDADPLQHDTIGLTNIGKAGDVAVFNTMLLQDCAPKSSMCVSPESVPDQFVSFNIPLGFEVFDGQESNSLDNNIFVSMVINALDKGEIAGPNPNQGDDPLQMKTTLDASIPIVAGGINIFCDGITAKTDLKDVANADIIVGSAANATELTRLRIIEDIASTNLDAVPSTQVDSDSIEAGLMTLVLKGNSSYFENGVVNTQGYSLELDDLITIHLMTDGEAPSETDAQCSAAITAGTESADCAVRSLLSEAPDDNSDSNGLDTGGYKLNGAFKFDVDRGLGIAKLEPTSDLLAICPFNPTRPSGGLPLESCITRRDVRSRTYPVRGGAAGPTAMEILAQTDDLVSDSLANEMLLLEGQRTSTCTCSEGDDEDHDRTEDECCEAGFMQMILGENDYARDLAVDYVKAIHQRYTLNGRYVRAYWINPGYEWTPTQAAGKSIFSVSQKVYLFALVTLDENISRRRMLLATDVSPTEDSGSGVGGAQLSFPVARTSIMAQAFDVPADRAVVFKVEMQLTQAEACMSDTEFVAQARATLEDYLDTAASSFHSVQVLGFSRTLNGVACRRALRKLLADFSEATASVQMLIVYKDEGEAVFNDVAFAGMAGITSVAVDPSSAGNVDVDPTYTNSVPNSKPGSEEDGGGGSSSNTAMIAGIAGGVGAAVLVLGGAMLFMRGRSHEAQVAEPVLTINVDDLKAQLNEDV